MSLEQKREQLQNYHSKTYVQSQSKGKGNEGRETDRKTEKRAAKKKEEEECQGKRERWIGSSRCTGFRGPLFLFVFRPDFLLPQSEKMHQPLSPELGHLW